MPMLALAAPVIRWGADVSSDKLRRWRYIFTDFTYSPSATCRRQAGLSVDRPKFRDCARSQRS
jgi:hypothetical protein